MLENKIGFKTNVAKSQDQKWKKRIQDKIFIEERP